MAYQLLASCATAIPTAAAGAVQPPHAAREWRACACGAVLMFAVHPLRVEALCWASCQPYLLAALFSLLAIAAAAAARRRHSAVCFGLALFFYTCATLSKAAAVPLPLCMLLLDIMALESRQQPPPAEMMSLRAAARWGWPHLVLWSAAALAAALAVRANPQGATLPLPCVSTAIVAETLPVPCISTAFVAETLPVPCVSTAFVAKTLPLPCVFPLPSWLRHCLCLVCFHCLRG